MRELDALVAVVLDDAERRCLQEEDRALAEARRLEAETAGRIQELEQAARALGRTRGQATDQAREAEAAREIDAVRAGAAEALWERFERRLVLALDALRHAQSYPEALAAWAAQAAAVVRGPVEVRAASRDRRAVYDALLAAGLEDFQVVVAREDRVGFSLHDPDGRTCYDCRPPALVRRQGEALAALLAERVPPFSSAS